MYESILQFKTKHPGTQRNRSLSSGHTVVDLHFIRSLKFYLSCFFFSLHYFALKEAWFTMRSGEAVEDLKPRRRDKGNDDLGKLL